MRQTSLGCTANTFDLPKFLMGDVLQLPFRKGAGFLICDLQSTMSHKERRNLNSIINEWLRSPSMPDSSTSHKSFHTSIHAKQRLCGCACMHVCVGVPLYRLRNNGGFFQCQLSTSFFWPAYCSEYTSLLSNPLQKHQSLLWETLQLIQNLSSVERLKEEALAEKRRVTAVKQKCSVRII